LLWVVWFVIKVDGKILDDEVLLMCYLIRFVYDCYEVVDVEFAQVVEVELEVVWCCFGVEVGDFSDFVEVGMKVVEIDGKINVGECCIFSELDDWC